MYIISSLAIITLAALIHASFQLSVSVLTLLSGHAIGAKRSQAKVQRLALGFIAGAGVMAMLLLSFTALVSVDLFGQTIPLIIWITACSLAVGIGVAVWLFYYRRRPGTMLWIPRGMAHYLSDRSKASRSSAEAFGLGLSSVLGELLFIAAPIIISALVLIGLPPLWQIVGIVVYTVMSILPLIIVLVLVGSGHRLSRIQKWREDNKHFIQFVAGSGLIVLGFFVYINQFVGNVAVSSGWL